MEPLYNQTNKQIQEVQQRFQDLNNPQANFENIENEILQKINVIDSNCDQLDILVFKVPISFRSNAKMRVDQLKYDVKHFLNALQIWQQNKKRQQIALTEREQLLNHRFISNSDTKINIDNNLDSKTSFNNSHKGVNEMIFTGGNILDNLRNQREKLINAKQRVSNIGRTLGLSDHIIKLLEKRLLHDKNIMFCGMVLTILVIIFLMYFFII